ncbi:iron-sulfur protein [Kitasatospora sp. NPDC096147]|uniref:iron-sulfur protein n=1 Tax=Kitasatospora sp. NPDC096147 TaxID=3364093 RepID=UPI0037F60A18
MAGTLRTLTGLCPGLRLHPVEPGAVGGPGPGPGGGWVPYAQLADRVEDLIAGEATRIAEQFGVVPRSHVAASRFLHHYLWSACLLLSGPWYLAGRIPEIDPAGLWTAPATGDLAFRPGGWADGGPAELRAAVAGHVTPVLEAFGPHLKRGPRALWGMVTDDLASGIWYLGRQLGQEEQAVRTAEAVLPGATAPFPGGADFRRLPGTEGRTHLTRTRLGCCLYYAVDPPAACLTCPRTSDAERVARLEV